MKALRLLAVFFVLLLAAGSVRPLLVVRLAFLGDLMLARGVDPDPQSLAYLSPYIASTDLTLANLESPLAEDPPLASSSYDLCAPASLAGILSGWGLDLLSIANNHADDCDPQGVNETRLILESAGIAPVGSDLHPVMRNVKGLSLAFFAFDDVSSPLDEVSAAESIRSARLGGSLVIVSMHWGLEYQGGASARQVSLARALVSSGASVIWGHHPHVLQPCEGCRSISDQHTIILYSLGNALFDQAGLEDTRRSALVLVTLNKQGVIDASIVPFEIELRDSCLLQPNAESTSRILESLKFP